MYQTVLVIECISLAILLLESIYTFLRWKTKNQSYLFLFCFSTLINNMAYLIEITATSANESFAAVRMVYIGKAWIPIAFLLIVLEICEFRLPRFVYGILVSFHTAIFVIVFTSGYHDLYYCGERIWDNSGMFPKNQWGHTTLYWTYMVLILSYILLGTVLLIHRMITQKEGHKRKLFGYLLASVITMAASYVIYMTGLAKGFDTTSLGYAVASVLMFIAIFRYHLMDSLSLVRDIAIDVIAEGVIAEDNNGRVIFSNEPFTFVLERSGMTKAAALESIKSAIENGQDIEVASKFYEPRMIPIIQSGVEHGKLYVLTDITAKQQYITSLKEQKDIAEAANASKSAFVSVVSHEIRTPMNAIVGMTDLLLQEQDNLNDTQVKYLKNIKTSGAALVMIVNDILDQSKIEAGKMEIVEDVYDLHAVVDDVKLIIENRIGSKNIELITEYGDGVPQHMIGDGLRVRQILINLMNNAVKFTEEGFIKICISCTDSKDDQKLIRFSVSDSGQGIRPEDLARLGEAFVQVDTRRNHAKEGTGLGLSISRDFINLMGGQLEVASEYGKGSEFFFSIWQKTATKEAEPDDIITPDLRVLVVDDTEINLMIAGEVFKKLEATVDLVKSGESAIDKVKENHYDIIFMDYMMPTMNGIEATTAIREISDTPVIALSGDDSEETREGFVNAGVSGFTDKPLKLKKLRKLLVEILPEEKIKNSNERGNS